MNDTKLSMDIKIVMLSGHAVSSRLMYNGLSDEIEIMKVIREQAIPMKKIMKNRAHKLGWFNVGGQIAFGLLLLPIIRTFSKHRKKEVMRELQLNDEKIPEEKLIDVSSVNSQECIHILKQINPDVVIVNGCRIISHKVLSAVDSVFINTHEGITPRYRGIHGAYWALANGDKENCGVTVHLVDKGVDTGGILYQSLIEPSKNDNFTTYPLHQTAAGIPLMKKAISDVATGNLKIIEPQLESRIWYHPMLSQYLWNYFVKGVK